MHALATQWDATAATKAPAPVVDAAPPPLYSGKLHTNQLHVSIRREPDSDAHTVAFHLPYEAAAERARVKSSGYRWDPPNKQWTKRFANAADAIAVVKDATGRGYAISGESDEGSRFSTLGVLVGAGQSLADLPVSNGYSQEQYSSEHLARLEHTIKGDLAAQYL
jgi:hypothetical protein